MADEVALEKRAVTPEVEDAPLDGPGMYAEGVKALGKARGAKNEYARREHQQWAQTYFAGAMAAAVGELAADDAEGTEVGDRWRAALDGKGMNT